MENHCCPWWMNYLIGNPLRRLLEPPSKLFGAYVKPGMSVLDAGCGMGVFTFSLASMAGPEGKVIAVDISPRNLAALERKARRKKLQNRITTVACDMGELPIEDRLDFALAANSVHEVPDFERFFQRLGDLLKPGGQFLMLEPAFHLSEQEFSRELELAGEAGLEVVERSKHRSRFMALLRKNSK